MNNKEILEYRLPDYLGPYLINGDASGLQDDEIDQINQFLEEEAIDILEMKDDSSFYWSNDLDNLGANCSTYTAIKINP